MGRSLSPVSPKLPAFPGATHPLGLFPGDSTQLVSHFKEAKVRASWRVRRSLPGARFASMREGLGPRAARAPPCVSATELLLLLSGFNFLIRLLPFPGSPIGVGSRTLETAITPLLSLSGTGHGPACYSVSSTDSGHGDALSWGGQHTRCHDRCHQHWTPAHPGHWGKRWTLSCLF